MNIHIPRGTMKPPLGIARMDWRHPFAKDLFLACIFNEGQWGTYGTTPNNRYQGTIYGTLADNDPVVTNSPSAGLTWGSNAEGHCVVMPNPFADFLRLRNTDFISTDKVTVCVIRRKRDSTNRSSALFGGSSTNAERCGLHAPYSDGVFYFDFGGQSGANRITWSGWTANTRPERIVCTAGPRGSAIWVDGVKVASQSTAITRTQGTSAFNLNAGNGAPTPGDIIDVNFIQVIDAQWDDALCRWWSAEPYAHLWSKRPWNAFDLGSGGISTPLARPTARTFAWGFV